MRNKNVLAKTEGEEGSLIIKGPDGEEAETKLRPIENLGGKRGARDIIMMSR